MKPRSDPKPNDNSGCMVSLLDAYVDGELPAEMMFRVHEHVPLCEVCCEHMRFIEAMRASTQRAVQKETAVSDAFRERVQAALVAERERQPHAGRASSGQLPWRSTVPLAAAALLLLAFGMSKNRSWLWFTDAAPGETLASEKAVGDRARLGDITGAARDAEDRSRARAELEQTLDRLVDYHTAPPAPQITEVGLVPELERDVGVRVQVPPLESYGARWKGASVIPIPGQQAASLTYALSNHRITVYIYDPTRTPLHTTLEPRVVGDQPVYVGQRRGYSIAAAAPRGVGYVLATDLNDRESAELVAAIH